MFDVKDMDLFDLEEEAFDTVIEDDITFTGSIRFTKPFMIRGKVKGSIDATSDLVIDSGASVEADIKALRVLVKGKVKGNVAAKKWYSLRRRVRSTEISRRNRWCSNRAALLPENARW